MVKVLLIEDDFNLRKVIQEIFELKSYSIFTASNGKEGIKKVYEVVPDIIICDIMMPDTSGYEVKTELDKSIEFSKIPFIFLTAKAELNDIRYGMNMGADDYIVKPFKINDLLKAVEVRLKKVEAIVDTKTSPNINKPIEKNFDEKDSIIIHHNSKPFYLKLSEIVCIFSNENYSIVHTTDGKKIMVRKLLKDWEKMLPSKSFFRAHKSTIINLTYIEKIDKWFSRTYKVELKYYDEPVIISQRRTAKLKLLFSF